MKDHVALVTLVQNEGLEFSAIHLDSNTVTIVEVYLLFWIGNFHLDNSILGFLLGRLCGVIFNDPLVATILILKDGKTGELFLFDLGRLWFGRWRRHRFGRVLVEFLSPSLLVFCDLKHHSSGQCNKVSLNPAPIQVSTCNWYCTHFSQSSGGRASLRILLRGKL